MKSENITAADRWYDDACGTALALELVGERWSLLIVRELMYGPRRFGELRHGLPGISANILTKRLEGLEAAGIVIRRRLPSPANAQVYELTPWGRESETAIRELGRWAVRSPAHDPTLPLSGASLMMSFRAMIDRDGAKEIAATIGFRLGPELFRARLEGGWLEVTRGDPDGAELILAAPNPMILAGVVYGGRTIAEMEAAGALRLEGDRALAERFVTLFPLPAKIDAG